MKHTWILLVAPLLALPACSTPKAAEKKPATETVMVVYNVKVGSEEEFLTTISRAWEIYRKEHLVFAEPHIVVRETENGRSRVTEIFTWVNHDAPNHAPQSVKDIWAREHTLCEDRNGRTGIAGGEVELLLPANK